MNPGEDQNRENSTADHILHHVPIRRRVSKSSDGELDVAATFLFKSKLRGNVTSTGGQASRRDSIRLVEWNFALSSIAPVDLVLGGTGRVSG